MFSKYLKKICMVATFAYVLNLSTGIAFAKEITPNKNSKSKIVTKSEAKKDIIKKITPYKSESIKSTEENFIKSLAKAKGISYEEAKKINEENETKSIKRMPELKTCYSTEKRYFRINSNITLVMAVEVKFIHNTIQGGNQISSVGEPYMGINGASLYRWSGSGFNKDVNIYKARISTTGQAYVEIGNNVGSSFDFSGLSTSFSTSTSTVYSTSVRTYVMNIDADDLW